MKQPKNLLHLLKPTRNTRKIANKLMTVASGEINLQRKHNLICHAAKVKAAMSAHSMADVIPFFSIFFIPFESNASIKPKENIFYTHYKENNICNIFHVLMFQQLLVNKLHRLSDSKFGREKIWVWSPTKLKKINK